MSNTKDSDVVFYPSWRFLKKAGRILNANGRVKVVIKGGKRAKRLQVPICEVLEGQPQGGVARYRVFLFNFRLAYFLEMACFVGYKVEYDGDRVLTIVKSKR